MSTKYERINIIFPKEVADKLRRVPSGSRSQLVVEATQKALQEKKSADILDEILELRRRQKPLSPGTIEKWVREERESHY